VLVGHSYAAVVDQVYAGQYPQDITGLVLVDPLAGFYFRGPSYFPSEVVDFDASRQEVEASQLPDVPLIVLTGGSGPYGSAQLLDEHRAIATRSPQGRHMVVPNSGHRIHQDQPDAVIATIKAVLEVAPSGGAATVSPTSAAH
jgi:pimeloyl-ACP methyl ester carboxylesterase